MHVYILGRIGCELLQPAAAAANIATLKTTNYFGAHVGIACCQAMLLIACKQSNYAMTCFVMHGMLSHIWHAVTCVTCCYMYDIMLHV